MPELPEVETVRTEIDMKLRGHKIQHVEVFQPRLRKLIPVEFTNSLINLTLKTIERRAKYILISFEENSSILIIHLGMSGRVSIFESKQVPQKHDHVVITFEDGKSLHYHDPRRFGSLILTDSSELLFRMIGPEPLSVDFTADILKESLKGKKTSIKAALLDQRVIAGLGNIYVSEALHQSFIHPETQAQNLDISQCAALVYSIQDVLQRAIAAGGSTLRDHKHTDGMSGAFQHQFNVYDQMNKICTQCHKGIIQRIRQNNRSTYLCDVCQIK